MYSDIERTEICIVMKKSLVRTVTFLKDYGISTEFMSRLYERIHIYAGDNNLHKR